MIDRKDFIIGKEFWYSDFRLNSKFKLKGDFSKVKVVLSGPYIKLKRIESNNTNQTSYLTRYHYIFYKKYKYSLLSFLFYTEQEAIESWNNEVEYQLMKLNKLFDTRICYIEKVFKYYVGFKDFIRHLKNNIKNINEEVENLIEFNDMKKYPFYYKINYVFTSGTNIDNFHLSFYFSILKLEQESDTTYVFSNYVLDEDCYNLSTIEEILDICKKNRKYYNSIILNKSNLEFEVINDRIFFGISEKHLKSVEDTYYNFVNKFKECYNNLYNHLLKLKK